MFSNFFLSLIEGKMSGFTFSKLNYLKNYFLIFKKSLIDKLSSNIALAKGHDK